MALPLPARLDALRGMVNCGLKKAASSLNLMLNSPIELEVPSISLFKPGNLSNNRHALGNNLHSSVKIGFSGPFTGTALLTFPPQSAARLVAALVGDTTAPHTLDAVMTETLNEVGNILINGIIGTIGNILEKPFEFSLPIYLEEGLDTLLSPASPPPAELTILLVRTRFETSQLAIEGNVFLLFEINDFNPFLSLLDNPNRQ